MVNVTGAEVSIRHFGEKETKLGKRQEKKDAQAASLVNLGTNQVVKIQNSLQLDKGVRMQEEEEIRREAEVPEGSPKGAIPKDGESVNLLVDKLPNMELLSNEVIEQNISELFPKVVDLSFQPMNDK